jgi:hypothetical protein
MDANSSTPVDPKDVQIQILQSQLESASAPVVQPRVQPPVQPVVQQVQPIQTQNSQQNMATMTLMNICSQMGSSKGTYSDIQPIKNFSDIQIGQMCYALNNKLAAAAYSIPVSSDPLKTSDPLTDNDTILSYCSPLANSQSSYQTKECVCNQLGPNPVLHTGTVKVGGVKSVGGIGGLDIGSTTVTGYYCSAK